MATQTQTKSVTDPKELCRIITPEATLSYPHLFKAQSIGNSPAKYGATFLFDKKSDLSTIKAAIKNAKIVKYGPDPKAWPTNLESPVSDGDDEKYAGKEGYAGCWVIKATSNEDNKPGVVDEHNKLIIDAGTIYPGCKVRAQMFARVWEYMGKLGVQFILDAVQKTGDGKSFSGKKAVTDIFAPIMGAGDEGGESTDNAGF